MVSEIETLGSQHLPRLGCLVLHSRAVLLLSSGGRETRRKRNLPEAPGFQCK